MTVYVLRMEEWDYDYLKAFRTKESVVKEIIAIHEEMHEDYEMTGREKEILTEITEKEDGIWEYLYMDEFVKVQKIKIEI